MYKRQVIDDERNNKKQKTNDYSKKCENKLSIMMITNYLLERHKKYNFSEKKTIPLFTYCVCTKRRALAMKQENLANLDHDIRRSIATVSKRKLN